MVTMVNGSTKNPVPNCSSPVCELSPSIRTTAGLASRTISAVVNALAKGVEKIKETQRVPAKRLSFIYVLGRDASY